MVDHIFYQYNVVMELLLVGVRDDDDVGVSKLLIYEMGEEEVVLLSTISSLPIIPLTISSLIQSSSSSIIPYISISSHSHHQPSSHDQNNLSHNLPSSNHIWVFSLNLYHVIKKKLIFGKRKRKIDHEMVDGETDNIGEMVDEIGRKYIKSNLENEEMVYEMINQMRYEMVDGSKMVDFQLTISSISHYKVRERIY